MARRGSSLDSKFAPKSKYQVTNSPMPNGKYHRVKRKSIHAQIQKAMITELSTLLSKYSSIQLDTQKKKIDFNVTAYLRQRRKEFWKSWSIPWFVLPTMKHFNKPVVRARLRLWQTTIWRRTNRFCDLQEGNSQISTLQQMHAFYHSRLKSTEQTNVNQVEK